MELKQVLPGKVSFTLERLGQPLTLNLLSLEDNVWMEENYPGEQLNAVYSEPRVKDILRILCRILDIESKRLISKTNIVEIDIETGIETNVEGLSLMDKLYKITGDGELAVVMAAIFEVRKRSNEIVQKLQEKYNDQKKTEVVEPLLGK